MSASGSSPPRTVESKPAVSKAERRRVFIVDDDELLRDGLGRGLRRLGYDVCGEASSGEDALERIPAVRPDIIVMDVELGTRLTGIDVANQLCKIVDIPSVFLTGSTDTAIAKLAGEAGSFGYVVKPVNAESLVAKLEMALAKHAAEVRLRRAHEELELVNARLRESEDRYRSLFEEAIEGVFRLGLDGTIVAANPAFARIVGFDTADALLGTSVYSFAVSPQDEQRLRALWTLGDATDTTDASDAIEFLWHSHGGAAITVELYGRILHDGFFQGFFRDLTEVRERKRAEGVALEANRAKTHFLANMSHEVRTPLNAVLGLSDAMLARTYGSLTPRQERALRTIHASGQHLLELINDALDVARIEAGRLAIELQDISLEPIVRECLAFVIEQAEARHQRVTIALDPTVDIVRADPRRLKQVLINLMTNAIKFSRDAGAIAVRARRTDDGLVELAVSDNGPGIAEHDRERIFEPFVTLDRSPRSGAGLGLALVKRMVELQGGTVRLEDEPTGGARFIVTVHEGRVRKDFDSKASSA
jgi:PAS domain S-box-containing protein